MEPTVAEITGYFERFSLNRATGGAIARKCSHYNMDRRYKHVCPSEMGCLDATDHLSAGATSFPHFRRAEYVSSFVFRSGTIV